MRLEETLRGEFELWKDQFLRVDAEHTRLLNPEQAIRYIIVFTGTLAKP